ncbi:MAG: hypothetical protein ACI8YQ_004324 [Polaribacter sp.]
MYCWKGKAVTSRVEEVRGEISNAATVLVGKRMYLNVIKKMDLTERTIKTWMELIRPPLDRRDQIDIGYTFENNELEVFEIRPVWDDKSKKTTLPIAKSTYIKSKKMWKLYWMNGNQKWEFYKPNGELNTMDKILHEIKADEQNCFWG